MRAIYDSGNDTAQGHHPPMLRHISQPLRARGLEADVGIETTGDGAMDDGLPLLLQQLDQLLFGADVALDPAVHVTEEINDCNLFLNRWNRRRHLLEVFPIEPVPV